MEEEGGMMDGWMGEGEGGEGWFGLTALGRERGCVLLVGLGRGGDGSRARG